jgi:hypothetical protein
MDFPTDEDAPWVLIEGAIRHFYSAKSDENVLPVIERLNAKEPSRRKVYAAALERYAGHDIVVSAGEFDESFVCVVGDSIICGAFGGARMLGDRDKVRIVASPMSSGQFYAVAVERARDGLIWLPTFTWCGANAEAKWAARINWQLPFWTVLWCVAIVLLVTGFTTPNPWPHRLTWLLGGLFVLKAGTAVLDLPVVHPPPQGHDGSKIFWMLSYPDPDDLDLSYVRLDRIDPENGWRHVYRYKAALAKRSKKTKR